MSPAHLRALKWAIDEAESLKGLYLPGTEQREAFERSIATARAALKQARAESAELKRKRSVLECL